MVEHCPFALQIAMPAQEGSIPRKFSSKCMFSVIAEYISQQVYLCCLTLISIPPGGELRVAPSRHQVTRGSKPGVGGIFFPSLALFSFMLFVLRF